MAQTGQIKLRNLGFSSTYFNTEAACSWANRDLVLLPHVGLSVGSLAAAGAAAAAARCSCRCCIAGSSSGSSASVRLVLVSSSSGWKSGDFAGADPFCGGARLPRYPTRERKEKEKKKMLKKRSFGWSISISWNNKSCHDEHHHCEWHFSLQNWWSSNKTKT